VYPVRIFAGYTAEVAEFQSKSGMSGVDRRPELGNSTNCAYC